MTAAPGAGSLAGRHALVTGGGRGIGASIARRLAADGARLTVLGRSLEALELTAKQLPDASRPFAVACDVTDAAAVAGALDAACRRQGPVDLLVTSAGQAASAPLGRTTDELWRRMLDVNLTGTFLCIRQVLPGMLAAGEGRIVNVASTAGLRGYAYVTAYAAAKHGVVGLTRALAAELAATRITVNAVCPGFTDTDLLRETVSNVMDKTGRSEQDALAELVRHNPQGRLVDPDEVADTVAWLCSAAARSITGQSISISGGEVT
jgi:NAD(P)-dependent dehydrogenase (short-subunit alcohol dehydrogenase family)